MCKGRVAGWVATWIFRGIAASSGLAAVCAVPGPAAWSQTVTRLSLDASGGEANGASFAPACSSDGRWIAFSSSATDLVANDANGAVYDVFLLDRTTGAIEIVSFDSSGAQSNADSHSPAVSDDGRFVVFLSDALDPADTDFTADVYLRDRQLSATTWISRENAYEEHHQVSLSRDGLTLAYASYSFLYAAHSYHVRRPATGQAWDWIGFAGGLYGASSHFDGVTSGDGGAVALHWAHYNGYDNFESAQVVDLQSQAVTANIAGATHIAGLSHDGRFVAFSRLDSRLIARDLVSGAERDVTPTTNGAPPDAAVSWASFSDDGRYVAYSSDATNLVVGDTNARRDAFVHDSVGHTTLRVHLSAGGEQANDSSNRVRIVADGSRVLFDSRASNLVAGDVAGHFDIFERTNCFPHALDADGDGFGAGVLQLLCVPVAPGFVPNALDCDDARATAYPGAPELCNGLDDDCDGAADEGLQGSAYCATSHSANNCVPLIEALGTPSASASSGFVVRVREVEGQRAGLVYYGLAPANVAWAPFNPSTLCVAAPRQRLAPSSSGGTAGQCDSVLSSDVLAFGAANPGALATPFAAGTTLYFQGWMREPAMPKGTILSGGWSVTLCP
jgi:Tol biopolymer transport system component